MNEKEIAYRAGYANGYLDAKKEERHGRWMPIGGVDELYACSVCGEWQFIPEDAFEYCPRCGNPMDLPNITEQTENALRKLGEQTHGDN